MTDCTGILPGFPAVKGRKVEVAFNGGDVSSDGGVLLLRQVDQRLGLTRRAAAAIPDPRRQKSCLHSIRQMLQQRVYGICQGYEDLNDHDQLRHDLLFQNAAGSDDSLSSSSTLCRLEGRTDRTVAVAINKLLVETFVGSFDRAPNRLVLDFDATDDPVHGQQEGRFFHGYYDHYCFLPLYVFCGQKLLVSYLRPSNIDGARHAWAILSMLVKRFRQEWPDVEIVLRADSGFCRHRMLDWCEAHEVDYIVGLARNSRLLKFCSRLRRKSQRTYRRTGRKSRLFADIHYSAKRWSRRRRVITKAEHSHQGENTRFVTTSLPGSGRDLYDRLYCARGDMENRIKEQQLGLFADRTSCHKWWPNQFRLLLSSMAYVLMQHLREQALAGTHMARAQCTTIRLKLLKIGAVITRNTRRFKVALPSAFPYQKTFRIAARRLALE